LFLITSDPSAAKLPSRVARRYIFIPKIQIWEYFGDTWNGKYWYILWPFVICYCHVVGRYILFPFCNFVLIWYISPRFLVYCTKKNLANLFPSRKAQWQVITLNLGIHLRGEVVSHNFVIKKMLHSGTALPNPDGHESITMNGSVRCYNHCCFKNGSSMEETTTAVVNLHIWL
jgi:hypothetical protein